MVASGGPGDAGGPKPGEPDGAARGDDLDRRRRELGAAIASKRPAREADGPASRTSGSASWGYALRLSSEFIAGVVVGVAIGWIVDSLAGTSPWGLIVFLLLGFGAGVLNVLRSAGMVAERDRPTGTGGKRQD